MKTNNQIREEVKKEATKDLISQVVGVLSALLPVLAILGVNLDWFNQEFIDSFAVLLSAIVALIVNLITIYRNHFSRKHAQEQNEVLKEKGLK